MAPVCAIDLGASGCEAEAVEGSDLCAAHADYGVELGWFYFETTSRWPGLASEKNWNGFACPSFRRDTLEAMIAAPGSPLNNREFKSHFDGDTLIVDCESDGCRTVIDPGCEGLYDLGECGWAWLEAEAEHGD